MTKSNLLELLHRAADISTGRRLILAGSQALFATTSAAPQSVERSEEADLLLVGVDRALFSRLEDELGMESQHLRETGVFAHPVGLGTIVLPKGWEGRLVQFGREDGLVNIWALEIHDLAASKLMAGRDKDFEFIHDLLDREICDFSTLMERMKLLRVASPSAAAVPDRLKRLAEKLREWDRDDLIRDIDATEDGVSDSGTMDI